MANYKDHYNKILSIPLEEFYMLAALGGLKQVYGFKYDINNFSKEDMLRILLHLADKRILTVTDNHFECCDEYKEVLSYLKYSQKIIEIKSSVKGCPACICYLGKDILVTRVSSVNYKRVLIHRRKYEHLCEYIYRAGYIDGLWSVFDEEESDGKEEIILDIKCIEIVSNYVTASIKIKKISGRNFILYDCDGNKICCEFSRRRLETYIKSICEISPENAGII